MGLRLGKSVVLVGMMGAGKSAVGRALAAQLGARFVDQDDEIEAASQSTVAELFAEYGEPFFRAKESLVLERLLDGPPCVLATGGGAYLQERNRALIAARAVAVWIQADVGLLWSRVRGRTNRPLLQTSDPLGTLRRLNDERLPVYALAPLSVEARPGRSAMEMARMVMTELAARPDVLGEVSDAPR